MNAEVRAEVAAALAEHLYNGCAEPACDPGSDPELCVRRPFLNHLADQITEALAPLIAKCAAEAWDRGFGSEYEGDGWPPNPYHQES